MNEYISSRWLSAEHVLYLVNETCFWMPFSEEMWMEIVCCNLGVKMKELVVW